MSSPRVDRLLVLYSELSAEQQSILRDMVPLASLRVRREVLADRLAASVPYESSAGVRW